MHMAGVNLKHRKHDGGTASPYGGTIASVPGTFKAENFDNGGQSVAHYDATSGNSGGAYRSTEVDIQATTDTGGGYHLGWARAGEWLKYTVNVTQTRSYTLNVRVANLGSGATFRIEVDGVDLTGPVRVPNAGGWDVWQTIAVPLKAQLNQGQRAIRLVMLTRNTENSGVGNYGFVSFQ
jgi:hypothetical protein